jgi:oxygen-independent coproporphyrinogen-3 oxidase
VLAGRSTVELCARLNARDLMIRYVLLRLKLLRLDRADFADRFGFEVDDIFSARLQHLESIGLLQLNRDAVVPTRDGILYIDDVCRSFYSEDVRRRLRATEPQPVRPLLRSLV